MGIKIAKYTKQLIDYYMKINPNLLYLVENPRGSRTGTQGLKGNYERSIVPSDLCKKVISKVEEHLWRIKNEHNTLS